MLTIIFEAHGTTYDNEAHLASGHNDIALSSLGIQQSKEMGERYKDDHFDVIFCSDLQRAVEKPKRIDTPFPGGESYTQTTARMKNFIDEVKTKYDGKRIMIIGHRATQFGLENVINGVPLLKLTSTHFKWQPGWKYEVR